MEVDKKKKKRVIREEMAEEETLRLKGKECESSCGAPTEEEVEEFFAILRRMKVAVKYFDERGRGGKEWREALEKPVLTADHGENVAAGEVGAAADDDDNMKKRKREVGTDEGFDLNAVAPEAAESAGA